MEVSYVDIPTQTFDYQGLFGNELFTELSDLYRHCFGMQLYQSQWTGTELLLLEGTRIYFLKLDDTLVATACIVPCAHGIYNLPQVENTCFFYNICVHPDHRRQGHARYLLETIFSFQELSDVVKSYTLEIEPSNIGAVNLYSSLGFRDMGPSENPGRALMIKDR